MIAGAMAMQFQRKLRYGPRVITPRMVSAYARSCQRKQEALPLLAEIISETQLDPETEMARRQVLDARIEAATRKQHADNWRAVRRRLFDLPDHARRAVLDRYHGNRWYPRTSVLISSVIWSELARVEVDPSSLPKTSPDDRLLRVRALNDRARENDTLTRCRYVYSPGAMAFLAPGFHADDDYDKPKLHLHTSLGRHALIGQGVRNFDDFGPNMDPSGERRSGTFEALGSWLRFEILYLGHQDDGPSVAPWIIDLSRRFIWIGLEGENVDLSCATFGTGWEFPRRD